MPFLPKLWKLVPMELTVFSQKLEEIVPKVEEVMENLDLDYDSAMSIIGRWYLPKNQKVEKVSSSFDDFILNYDYFNLNIGLITFSGKIFKVQSFLNFGALDENWLCLDPSTSEVLLINSYPDFKSGHHEVLNYCCSNFDSFLEVLLIYAEYEKRRFLLQETLSIEMKRDYMKKSIDVLNDRSITFCMSLFDLL